MPFSQELLIFSLVMWVAQFTPGPDMILIIKNTLNHGRRAGWGTTAGIVTGLMAHCLLVGGGMAAVLQAHPGWWQGLRWAAAAYLAWIAWRLWREKENAGNQADDLTVETDEARHLCHPEFWPRFYREGLGCNLVNVKAVAFLAGTGVAFLHPRGPAWQGLVLMGIVLAQAIVGWGAFVWLIGHPAVRMRFLRARGVLNRVFALLLWALAVKMII